MLPEELDRILLSGTVWSGLIPDMTLSPAEQQRLREGLYVSEVRNHYYAYLSAHYQHAQVFLTWVTLVLSGGAAATFVAKFSTNLPWIPPTLAILTAAVSAYSLLAKNERKGIDSSRLSQKYAQVAHPFDVLFGRMQSATSAELQDLEQKKIELGEAGQSLAYIKRLMKRAEKDVKKARRL